MKVFLFLELNKHIESSCLSGFCAFDSGGFFFIVFIRNITVQENIHVFVERCLTSATQALTYPKST